MASDSPMGIPEHVVTYCQQREAFLAAQRATADERAETADAVRTLGGLLTESMQRHGVRCVRLARQSETPDYIRIVPERRRALQLRNLDDVLALLDGITHEVTDVPFEELPQALTRAVGERARQRGRAVPARVQITKRVGAREQITEVDRAAPEVQTLSTQLHDAHAERQQLTTRLRPLRTELRRAEDRLTDTAPVLPSPTPPPPPDAQTTPAPPQPEPDATPPRSPNPANPSNPPPAQERIAHPPSVLVEMRPRDGDGPSKVLRVTQQPYVKRRPVFGLKRVCEYVRTAMERIPTRGDDLERRIRDEVAQIVRSEEARPPQMGVRLAVRKEKTPR